MTTTRMIELAAALAILAVGIWLYRRRQPEGYGSQGAVLLFAIAGIMGIHALGGLDYHPSAAEREFLKASRAR